MLLTIEVDEVTGKVTIDPAAAARKQAASGEWDGSGIAGRLIKTDSERRFTLCLAYPSMRPDVARAADGFRDFAGPEAIENAAWEFMLKSQDIGLWHKNGTSGAGKLVENTVYRGPDWEMTAADGTKQVIKSGDWLIGIQWSPESWELVKKGLVRGVSMQGTAVRRKPAPEALASLRKEEGE